MRTWNGGDWKIRGLRGRDVPVKIALRIEPRDVSPCWLMHISQLFVILVEIGFPVIGYRPRGQSVRAGRVQKGTVIVHVFF